MDRRSWRLVPLADIPPEPARPDDPELETARSQADGGEVELAKHDLLYVEPTVGRGAIALETPTKLFIVGGKPGMYEPPAWASDWRPEA